MKKVGESVFESLHSVWPAVVVVGILCITGDAQAMAQQAHEAVDRIPGSRQPSSADPASQVPIDPDSGDGRLSGWQRPKRFGSSGSLAEGHRRNSRV